MKVLVTSLLLFVIVIAAVTINATYVHKTIDIARELAEVAYKNSASEEALNELSEHWDSTVKLLSLSVNLREIDTATENLLVFLSACRDGYEYGIEQSYTLFIDSLDDIVKYEKFEMANIL
ncbi:MAG: hypothetical protein IJZ83_10785 [Clostridia bacterium]|nr:hypothetical protein [Clostridia bacterium]